MGAVDNTKNAGIAFALTIAAGASTAIGASVVFFPKLVQLASRKTLAGGLGLSAGVMSYVSFVEIFQKSKVAFEDAGYEENMAYVYATLTFFGGVILMLLLNFMVHGLLGYHHHDDHDEKAFLNTDEVSGGSENEQQQPRQPTTTNATSTSDHNHHHRHNHHGHHHQSAEEPLATCPCSSHDPVAQMDEIHHMAEEIQHDHEQQHNHGHHHQHQEEEKTNTAEDTNCSSSTAVVPNPPQVEEAEEGNNNEKDNNNESAADAEKKEALRLSKLERKKLARMSLKTAVAIGIHNFPEGLATFVAALHDPKVGGVLALAIAIHNIPEGLCVAMPVYYATGNRCRAFLWAVLSGVSEPVAALLGWIVLANSFSDTLYAILFGMVAGMMVIISVRELLPTAHRYDPEDTVVTNMFIMGMAIMALSLVLFML